ncbi:MAG TPA: hypothetical protein PKY01_11100, partial [Candidatus Hydrogenedentes bacterium]|nr:hypothetical protein [Candidatus Hydrogenedentota bacterium]
MTQSTRREGMQRVKISLVFVALFSAGLSWCVFAAPSDAAGGSGNPEQLGGQPEFRTNAMTIEHPNLPRGYEMAAYVDCGPQLNSGERPEGRIALVTGTPHTFSEVQGPISDAAFDAVAVQYEITGLDAGTEYVLG